MEDALEAPVRWKIAKKRHAHSLCKKWMFNIVISLLGAIAMAENLPAIETAGKTRNFCPVEVLVKEFDLCPFIVKGERGPTRLPIENFRSHFLVEVFYQLVRKSQATSLEDETRGHLYTITSVSLRRIAHR